MFVPVIWSTIYHIQSRGSKTPMAIKRIAIHVPATFIICSAIFVSYKDEDCPCTV